MQLGHARTRLHDLHTDAAIAAVGQARLVTVGGTHRSGPHKYQLGPKSASTYGPTATGRGHSIRYMVMAP